MNDQETIDDQAMTEQYDAIYRKLAAASLEPGIGLSEVGSLRLTKFEAHLLQFLVGEEMKQRLK